MPSLQMAQQHQPIGYLQDLLLTKGITCGPVLLSSTQTEQNLQPITQVIVQPMDKKETRGTQEMTVSVSLLSLNTTLLQISPLV